MARSFDSNQAVETDGILCVFRSFHGAGLGQKNRQPADKLSWLVAAKDAVPPCFSSTHKPHRSIFRKQKIPPVTWHLLFPTKAIRLCGGSNFGYENNDDSKRCYGRARMALPIEPPAPRPCSAAACRTRSHLAGFSDRCYAAYSPLHRIYSLYGVLYPGNRPFVNSLSALFLDGNLHGEYNKKDRRRFCEK